MGSGLDRVHGEQGPEEAMEGVPGGVTSSSMLELDAKHLILAAVGERCVVAASAMTAAWVRGGATRRRGRDREAKQQPRGRERPKGKRDG